MFVKCLNVEPGLLSLAGSVGGQCVLEALVELGFSLCFLWRLCIFLLNGCVVRSVLGLGLEHVGAVLLMFWLMERLGV